MNDKPSLMDGRISNIDFVICIDIDTSNIRRQARVE